VRVRGLHRRRSEFLPADILERLDDLLDSLIFRCAAWGLFFALVIGAGMTWEQRHVFGQPDEDAVVTSVVDTGKERGSGKSRCDEARYGVRIDNPRPDIREKEPYFLECTEMYEVAEETIIRRVPGHPNRSYSDPVPFLGILMGVGSIVLAFIVFGLLCIAVMAGWYRVTER
jgi:hypothetical protein